MSEAPACPLTGVVLMTYGSPRDREDVAAYLTRVRGGRTPSEAVLAEFGRRYERIGGSPLVRITREQARALETALGVDRYRVAAGMRFSAPSMMDAVTSLAGQGVERVLGLIMSPQYSPILMRGYEQALRDAAEQVGLTWRLAGAWHLNRRFVEALARRVREALEMLPEAARGSAPVLLTAHSLPRRVVDEEPGYVTQLRATAERVAAAAGLDARRWQFVYQSAGHTPEEWLRPDLLDVLPDLAAAGHREVVVAPVQFLADHLETLYDIDVAGSEQARAAGIERLIRIPAFNDAPDFAGALASVVESEASAWAAAYDTAIEARV